MKNPLVHSLARIAFPLPSWTAKSLAGSVGIMLDITCSWLRPRTREREEDGAGRRRGSSVQLLSNTHTVSLHPERGERKDLVGSGRRYEGLAFVFVLSSLRCSHASYLFWRFLGDGLFYICVHSTRDNNTGQGYFVPLGVDWSSALDNTSVCCEKTKRRMSFFRQGI
jgi:hypothetical protein